MSTIINSLEITDLKVFEHISKKLFINAIFQTNINLQGINMQEIYDILSMGLRIHLNVLNLGLHRRTRHNFLNMNTISFYITLFYYINLNIFEKDNMTI
jgi:hypothetical protein